MSDTSGRPKVVNSAFWCWVVAAVLLVVVGLLVVTVDGDSIRDRVVENGHTVADADSFLRLLRGTAVITLVSGLAIGFLAGPVRAGRRRLRRALVALSVVVAIMSAGLILVGLGPTLLLPVPILLAVAGVLVYRPAAQDWYDTP